MLGWQPLCNKAMAAGVALVLSVLATNVEAGVFNWLKRTEIQWSPEIHGVVTENGIPVSGLKVVRELHYEDDKFSDNTVTDHEGRFTFSRKTLRTRRVLFDYSIYLFLSVADHPTTGEQNRFFDIRWGNRLDGRALNLLMSNMQCELTAEAKDFSLKNLEAPDSAAPWFSAKCTFTHADTALYSDEEIEAQMQELDRIIDKQEGI
ncbi:DUF6795 domain-containing protein [Rheinheimera sp.]|uniref:DUF6795 domain-containing protein n=1 Tax=Rheinheimera sp. TaxID=1869214 RepID=UPI00404881B7